MPFDLTSYLLGKNSGGGGGGGENPNNMVTIEGTLADPWGNYSYAELVDLLKVSSLGNAYMELNGQAIGMPNFDGPVWAKALSLFICYSIIYTSDVNDVTAVYIEWNYEGQLNYANIAQGGTVIDISQYATYIPTTLSIFTHPTPDM